MGPAEKLEELRLVVGRVSKIDLKALPSNIVTKRIVVTKNQAIRKSIQELNLTQLYGVTVTRVTRAGLEFTAAGHFRLQFGDILMAVGEPDAIRRVAEELGDSPEHLDHPHILPIFLGIALGVILGSFPFYFPGIPASVKLGLAGGPLLTAIVLSRVGRMGPLIWYIPVNANLLLREIGITLFLGCVGLRAGEGFVQTLTNGQRPLLDGDGCRDHRFARLDCLFYRPGLLSAQLPFALRSSGRQHDRPAGLGLRPIAGRL